MTTHSVHWSPLPGLLNADALVKLALLACITWLVFQKDVSLDFRLSAIPEVMPARDWFPVSELTGRGGVSTAPAIDLSPEERAQADRIRTMSVVLGKDYLRRKKISPRVIQEKIRQIKAYLDRFAPLALQEMKQHGIPASITLAQGLLESDAGGSRLATESNNHFGIKCKSRCRGCTCRNYSDDDAYDMFRVYGSAEESFRDHSDFLTRGKRYKSLFRLNRMDYRGWAQGLKKAGYATDPKYADKLITIIESLKLHRYDQPVAPA